MDEQERMARIKRVKQKMREEELLDEIPVVHPMIEKVSRAISDWQSEVDWPIHTDQAVRSIEAVAEQLQREGHEAAVKYLRSVIWAEPKPRPAPEPQRQAQLFF